MTPVVSTSRRCTKDSGGATWYGLEVQLLLQLDGAGDSCLERLADSLAQQECAHVDAQQYVLQQLRECEDRCAGVVGVRLGCCVVSEISRGSSGLATKDLPV